MKTWIIVVVAAISGAAWGTGWTYFEFAQDRGPVADGSGAGGPVTDVAAGPLGGAARVEIIGEAEYDFGQMEKDATTSHTFLLKSAGTGSLRLTKGTTTCKCTLSNLSSESVPPGETAEVTLEWTPGSFSPSFRQSATIHTNDPAQPTLQLEVYGRVIQTVRPIPEELTFSNVSINDSRTAEVLVFCYRTKDFQLADWRFEDSTASEFFDIDIKPLADDAVAAEPGAKAGAKVAVTLQPGLPLGPIDQTLQLKTNLADGQEIPIRIQGQITGDIKFVPGKNFFDSQRNVLTLGTVGSQDGGKFQLHVLVKGPFAKDVKLSVGEIDPAGVLRASIDSSNPTSYNDGAVLLYPLTVEIPPGARAVSRLGSANSKLGKIVIETTHPQTPQVLLYVKFAVKS